MSDCLGKMDLLGDPSSAEVNNKVKALNALSH